MTRSALALKRHLDAAGTSMHDLAGRLGVTKQAVQSWCAGRTRPASLEMRLALERLTSVPAAGWLTPAEVAEANRLNRLDRNAAS